MKKIIIIILSITFPVIYGQSVGYNKYPFTNVFENVYIDGGKHLLRVDVNFKGEFIVNEGTEILGEHSFDGCKNLTSIIIPDTVTNIMRSAFYACSSLTNVVFGSGLREIGENAFLVCRNFGTINLPDSLETIGERAFAGCIIKEIKIGKGLRNFDNNTFIYGDEIPGREKRDIKITISPSNQWLRVEGGKIVPKKQDEQINENAEGVKK